MFPLKDDIPTRRFPVLTVGIIVINSVMFFGFQGAFFGSDADFNQRVVDYGAIPYEVTHPGEGCGAVASGELACSGQAGVDGEAPAQPATWLTLFTSMFMHGGLLHIAGNMLFLWVFGNNIEDSMGRVKFVFFYLLEWAPPGMGRISLMLTPPPGVTARRRALRPRRCRRARTTRRSSRRDPPGS